MRNILIKVLHKKKDVTECRNHRNISLLTYAGKVLLKIVATRCDDYYCETKGLLLEEHCGFRSRHSTLDIMYAARRWQGRRQKARGPLCLYFIDLQTIYDSVHRSLLLQVLASFRVPPRVITFMPTPRWEKSMREERQRGWGHGKDACFSIIVQHILHGSTPTTIQHGSRSPSGTAGVSSPGDGNGRHAPSSVGYDVCRLAVVTAGTGTDDGDPSRCHRSV